MKTRSQVSKHKTKKSSKNDSAQRQRHRISLNDFPDAILSHILSFLPTKSAVGTSVLSKRWRYMWTSLPILGFDEEKVFGERVDAGIERKKFLDFVEGVLCLHNAPRIKKFSLSCWVRDDVSCINKCISTAVSRNLQEFDIAIDKLRVDDQDVLPHCLFSSQTLEVLNIDTGSVLLPSQICLPNLKKLRLRGISFTDYDGLNLLFTGSALEVLVIEDCRWEVGPPGGQLIISAPNLQSLTIDESYQDFSDELDYVTISSMLTTFSYDGAFIRNYRLSCSSSIERATLLLVDIKRDAEEILLGHFHKVLVSVCFTKYLKLSAYAVGALSYGTVPIFENLISLEIPEDLVEDDNSYKGLEMFLIKCPHLETLKITQGVIEDCDISCLLSPELVCLSSLKNITIVFGKRNMEELLALHVLLAKATSLETMEINFSSRRMSLSERWRIKTFLNCIHLGSKSCKLKFKLIE